jgi:hypothetical protein
MSHNLHESSYLPPSSWPQFLSFTLADNFAHLAHHGDTRRKQGGGKAFSYTFPESQKPAIIAHSGAEDHFPTATTI